MNDEHDSRPVEQWMIGLRVIAVSSYYDGDGQRWNKIALSDGSAVHIPALAPWLVIDDKPHPPTGVAN